jgi:hypothetical protein
MGVDNIYFETHPKILAQTAYEMIVESIMNTCLFSIGLFFVWSPIREAIQRNWKITRLKIKKILMLWI